MVGLRATVTNSTCSVADVAVNQYHKGRIQLMRTEPLEQVIAEIAGELSDDDVGLWVVVRAFRDRWPEFEGMDIRLLVAHVCRALQSLGASLGQFTANGDFDEWPAEESVDRMLMEWSDLRRDPDIGEVAWIRRNG